MEKVGLLDRAIAPLHWLERSRGWRRLGLVLLYLLIVAVVGVLGWRELSLWRLPKMGEPFDTVKYGTIPIADGEDAMDLYREAASRLVIPGLSTYRVASSSAWDVLDWNSADPEIRRWVADNRAGFAIWARGTELPDSLLVQPKDLGPGTDMVVIHSLPNYARVALLEGSRLEQAGDLEGAWGMYRRILRSSRHAGRHGGLMPRLVGQSMLVQVRPSIRRWLGWPEVTPALLRQAIGDLDDCVAMTSPTSEMIRAEYFAWKSTLSRPEGWYAWGLEGTQDEGTWYQHLSFIQPTRRFFQHEPERSLRVHRLVTAGLLAQCDRPRSERPKLNSVLYMIYDLDARTPSAVASISPEELAAWADRSAYRFLAQPMARTIPRIEAERGLLDALRIELAERAYEIERGKPPATYGDLLGAYLKALPEGFEPGDATISSR